ncbi:MAG: hypothetical protein MUE44_09015 [Oscillatoriaceae cyanobacterium Prado104]|nr:hypothetical protein [Oscillatoriaceae cyanobacterium Prado104]
MDQTALALAVQAITSKTPVLAIRMPATLNFLLSGVRASPEQATAWTFSTLSGNGYPVEFTFSSMEESIRYTVEVAGPEVDPRERLSRIEHLLNKLDGTHSYTETIAHFRHIQADRDLKWGAWLGVRHLGEKTHYKIYAEVPQAGLAVIDQVIDQIFGYPPLLEETVVCPTAIGHQLGSLWTEYYFIIEQFGLLFKQIQSLLWRAGLYERSRELLELIQEVRGYSDPASAPGFPPAKYGFSYAISTAGAPVIFTFFAFARRLIGSDAEIRRNLLALAERRGWNFEAYAELTAPLATWDDRCDCHNVIAFVVAPKGPLGLHVSLSPPNPVM